MSDHCIQCEVAAGARAPRGTLVAREAGFLFHATCDPRPVAGWMVLAPGRHVEGWDALSREEAATLGELIRRGVAAVKAVTGAPKVYVALFAEAVPHLHVHLVPRGDAVPAQDRGPRFLFDLAPRAGEEEVARVAVAVVERFRAAIERE